MYKGFQQPTTNCARVVTYDTHTLYATEAKEFIDYDDDDNLNKKKD